MITKLLKFVFLLLVLQSICFGTTHVVTQNGTTNASSSLNTATWTANNGDIIVCSIATFNETILLASDSNSASFSTVANVATPGGAHTYIYYLLKTIGGASYSVTFTGSAAGFISGECSDFTPSASSTFALDNSATASGSTSTATVNLTSLSSGDLIIGSVSKDDNTTANIVAGSGYTIPTNGQNVTSTNQPSITEYNLSGASGTVTVNMQVNSAATGWAIVAVAFKLIASPQNATIKGKIAIKGKTIIK